MKDIDMRKIWDFLDTNHTNSVTASDLKKSLGIFAKDITSREIRFLMNNQPEMSFEDWNKLLEDSQLPESFDPVQEAFKLFDTNNTGTVDLGRIKEFFQEEGYGRLDADELKILVGILDTDKDGSIGISDFRQAVTKNHV